MEHNTALRTAIDALSDYADYLEDHGNEVRVEEIDETINALREMMR